MRRALLGLVLALAACGAGSPQENLPRAAELGAGFDVVAATPPSAEEHEAVRRADLEAACARAGIEPSAGRAALLVLTGGRTTPSLASPLAWLAEADGPAVEWAEQTYERRAADDRLTLRATLLAVPAPADLDALGLSTPSDAAFADALAVAARLAAAEAASPRGDRAAEGEVLRALAASPPDVPAAIRDVTSRRQLETVTRGRTLDVGDGGLLVVTATRRAGRVRAATGFGRVRVGRAVLVFEVDADGAAAATLHDDLPDLVARLAGRLAVYGETP